MVGGGALVEYRRCRRRRSVVLAAVEIAMAVLWGGHLGVTGEVPSEGEERDFW